MYSVSTAVMPSGWRVRRAAVKRGAMKPIVSGTIAAPRHLLRYALIHEKFLGRQAAARVARGSRPCRWTFIRASAARHPAVAPAGPAGATARRAQRRWGAPDRSESGGADC